MSIPDSPYVPEALRGATVNAPSEAVARGIAAGLASIGLPYVWGGGTNGGQADQGCSRGGGSLNSCAGTVGFDCSGLTAYVLTQAGFAIGTNSGSQRAGGQSVPWSQAYGRVTSSATPATWRSTSASSTACAYLLEAPSVGDYVHIRPVYFTNGGSGVDGVLHRYWSL